MWQGEPSLGTGTVGVEVAGDLGQGRSMFQGGKVLGVMEREAWKSPEKTNVAGARKRVRTPKHRR